MQMIVNNATLIKISGNIQNKSIIMSKTKILKLLLLNIFNKDVVYPILNILITFPVFHYQTFKYFYQLLSLNLYIEYLIK